MGLLIVVLILFLLLGGYGHGAGWGYYGWSPLGLLLVVVLILWLAGVVHAEELSPTAVGGVLLLGVLHRGRFGAPGEESGSAGPPGLPFAMSYWLGVIITVALAGIGFVQAEFAAGHGADFGLDARTFAWLSVGATMLGVLGKLLPNVQHTPTFRKRELLHARSGWLPRDLHKLAPGGEPPAH